MRRNDNTRLTFKEKARIAVPAALAAAALIYLNEAYWHVGELHLPASVVPSQEGGPR
jgi:hypothetical protein